MSNVRIERPNTVIKTTIAQISSPVKVKVANAIALVVNKIKEKHLS